MVNCTDNLLTCLLVYLSTHQLVSHYKVGNLCSILQMVFLSYLFVLVR
nr:MAG TPA: hypothetical protein [Caudoviricetes sp.]DAT02560.1 MAG TPA: hypothetical protein [Caudoviricetes sp.]